MDPYEVPKGALVFGGVHYGCEVPTVLWTASGFEYKPGKGARTRTRKPRVLVTHHTAGEETPAGLYHVLTTHGLGVEFSIYPDGRLFQHCDPILVDTFDAGFANTWSCGVEIVNAGVAPCKPQRFRESYKARVNGRDIIYLRYTPKQLESYLALCNTVCDALKIPKVVPHQLRTMGPAELDAFTGILGHFHLTEQKPDPGTEPFEFLRKNGYSDF